jgi:hypothetical protein
MTPLDINKTRRKDMSDRLKQSGASGLVIRVELDSPKGTFRACKAILADELEDWHIESMLLERLGVALYQMERSK